MTIRACTPADAADICAIYNHYVRNTVITFEEEPVSVSDMRLRIENCTRTYPWLVREIEGRVVGYAYATRWKERAAYRHSVEVSVYVAANSFREGHGRALYAELIARLAQRGCHALIGGIALPNDASVALHETFGFTKVAHFTEVGHKFGRWIDVGYWQKTAGTTSTNK